MKLFSLVFAISIVLSSCSGDPCGGLELQQVLQNRGYLADGYVLDESSLNPIPGCNVHVQQSSQGIYECETPYSKEDGLITNENGYFSLNDSAKFYIYYEISIQKEGYESLFLERVKDEILEETYYRPDSGFVFLLKPQ